MCHNGPMIARCFGAAGLVLLAHIPFCPSCGHSHGGRPRYGRTDWSKVDARDVTGEREREAERIEATAADRSKPGRCPTCGEPGDDELALELDGGKRVRFCSASCKTRFVEDPEPFMDAVDAQLKD